LEIAYPRVLPRRKQTIPSQAIPAHRSAQEPHIILVSPTTRMDPHRVQAVAASIIVEKAESTHFVDLAGLRQCGVGGKTRLYLKA